PLPAGISLRSWGYLPGRLLCDAVLERAQRPAAHSRVRLPLGREWHMACTVSRIDSHQRDTRSSTQGSTMKALTGLFAAALICSVPVYAQRGGGGGGEHGGGGGGVHGGGGGGHESGGGHIPSRGPEPA